MKRLILTLAAASALSTGAPAAAQTTATYLAQFKVLQTRLDAGIRTRKIDPGEASALRDRIRELRNLEREFRRGGYSTAERQSLREKMQLTRTEIRRAIQNGGTVNCPPDLVVRNQLCVRPAVGQVYTAKWPAVPSRYGSRYRDTSRYWYRFDNVDRIYQIDRRTGRIVRITRV